ncbi:type II secretion system F family protein [Candidatus Kuenenbacteria bacterium]|nr:type II secretion system F family protein [Candidatus Kuenenbacteria bacterium]
MEENQSTNRWAKFSVNIKKIDFFLSNFFGVSTTEKIFFTQNLSVMIKSGLALDESLESLSYQTKNRYFKEIIKQVKQKIEKGIAFSDSLAMFPKIFSLVFINIIRAGEESGKLDNSLKQLAIQMKKNHELVSKIKGALIYPIIVVTAMIGIIIFMMVVIIPQITQIFESFGSKLPIATQILIKISKFSSEHGIILLIGFILIFILLIRLIRISKIKYFVDKIILRIPIIGGIIRKINLAKFSRTFSSLLKTGVPIVETFRLSALVLNNLAYQKELLRAAEIVKKGESITKILKESPILFPPIVTQMIDVGEKTGTLDSILEDLAIFYEEEIDQIMTNLPQIIEPILLVFLGAGVAFIAIAVLMPMYSMTQNI